MRRPGVARDLLSCVVPRRPPVLAHARAANPAPSGRGSSSGFARKRGLTPYARNALSLSHVCVSRMNRTWAGAVASFESGSTVYVFFPEHEAFRTGLAAGVRVAAPAGAAPRPRRSCCRWPPASATTRPTTTRLGSLSSRRSARRFLAACALPAVARSSCVAPKASAAYAARASRTRWRRTETSWGDELLRSRSGPTLSPPRAGVALAPLLYARSAGRRRLTRSGVYLPAPFDQPDGPLGAGTVALHVADGSEIVSQRVGGPALTEVSVAGSPYGACLSRLTPATLADGWLPILETRYSGYTQESFAARIPETKVARQLRTGYGPRRDPAHADGALGSGGRETASCAVRGPTPCSGAGGPLDRALARLPQDGLRGSGLTPADRPVPSPGSSITQRYVQARASVGAYWRSRLDEGATLEVPERHVMDAPRARRVPNIGRSWRYSIGNPNEEASFPESLDQAQVMAELGFDAVGETIVRVSLTRRETSYPNWTMGEKLLAAAACDRLAADHRFLNGVTPVLAGYVLALSRRQQPGGFARSPSSSPRTSRRPSLASTRRHSPGRACARSPRPGGTPGIQGMPSGPSASPAVWRRRFDGPWPTRNGGSATGRSSCR